MKKYGSLIGVIVLIIISAYYFLILNGNSNEASGEGFSDFEVKDTANVVKFIISDTENNTITLTREQDGQTWMIGETGYKAQQSSIDLITETFYRIKIKQDVDENAIENVLTQLAVRHKKVEIFMKGESSPVKTWYVGSGTNDHMGTYMLLMKNGVKSEVPYITYKPDMYGTLDVRFFTDFQTWRSSNVFAYKHNSIQEVNVEFSESLDNSYSILVDESNNVSILDHAKMPVSSFDSSQVKHYLTHYKKIHFESVNKELDQQQVDSVLAITPHYTINVTGKDGSNTSVRLWKMGLPDTYKTAQNEHLEWNPERAWCSINGDKELVKIQYFSWDVLLKPKQYFLK